MKKITGKLSLQWRLTLITALLMTVTCILMYFFISQSAVAGMENLGDYMIRIDNTDSATWVEIVQNDRIDSVTYQ